jgi:hypothetical protein
MIQLVSPGIQAIAGAVPVVGGPLKAAIGGLSEILQAIDVRVLLFPMMPLDPGHREIYKISKTSLA